MKEQVKTDLKNLLDEIRLVGAKVESTFEAYKQLLFSLQKTKLLIEKNKGTLLLEEKVKGKNAETREAEFRLFLVSEYTTEESQSNAVDQLKLEYDMLVIHYDHLIDQYRVLNSLVQLGL